MRAITVLLFFALVGNILCKPSKRTQQGNSPALSSSSQSSSSEEETFSNDLRMRQTQPSLASPSSPVSPTNTNFTFTHIPEHADYINSVEIFKAKVANRLAASVILAKQPDMRSRFMSVALDKFKLCENSKDPNDMHNHGTHSCLGSATGQMMSLISAYERNQNEALLDSAK